MYVSVCKKKIKCVLSMRSLCAKILIKLSNKIEITHLLLQGSELPVSKLSKAASDTESMGLGDLFLLGAN